MAILVAALQRRQLEGLPELRNRWAQAVVLVCPAKPFTQLKNVDDFLRLPVDDCPVILVSGRNDHACYSFSDEIYNMFSPSGRRGHFVHDKGHQFPDMQSDELNSQIAHAIKCVLDELPASLANNGDINGSQKHSAGPQPPPVRSTTPLEKTQNMLEPDIISSFCKWFGYTTP